MYFVCNLPFTGVVEVCFHDGCGVMVFLGEVRSLGVLWPGADVFPFKTCLTRVQLCIVMASEMCYATELSVFWLQLRINLTLGLFTNGAP
jgi:hypothetical protein